MTDTVNSSNVYKKWAKVMSKIEGFDLDSFHPDKKYKYSSGANIMNTVRPILAEVGLILQTKQMLKLRIREQIVGNKGWYNRVVFRWRLVDADNPDSATEWATAEGEAIDYSGDKGGAAARTYALKNLIADVFLVRGDDDVDTDAGNGVDWSKTHGNQPRRQDPPQQQRPQQPPPRQQSQPPPIDAAERFKQQEAPQRQETANGQPQPDQTPTAAKADPEHTPSNEPVYTVDLFKKQATELGFDSEGYKVTLSRFKNFRNSDGQLAYKPSRHAEMVSSLEAWKSLVELMQELGLTAAPEDELNYLGVTPPYESKEAIIAALPVIRQHADFVAKAVEIAGDKVATILKSQGLLPWAAEKSEMMLQALRGSVEAEKLVAEANEDIVEQVEDPVDLVTEVVADGDEFSVTSMEL